MNAGLILFLIFILCLVIGVPVSISLSVASLAAVVFGGLPASSTAIAQRIFGGLQSSSIMAIAFFVLAGNLMTKGGISRRIVDFADCLVGNVRGGMSLALVLACAFFAALSGSAPATVIRNHALRGYDQKGLSRAADRRTSGSVRWAWAHHPAIYYHGDLLYADRCLCWKYVQAGDDDWYCDYAGTDGGGTVVCP